MDVHYFNYVSKFPSNGIFSAPNLEGLESNFLRKVFGQAKTYKQQLPPVTTALITNRKYHHITVSPGMFSA